MKIPPAHLKEKLERLKKLYGSVPATRCTKTSCADRCCTKLPHLMSAEGRYISLPLLYSIEFLNIRDYVEKNFSADDRRSFYDYGDKKPLCCFKDKKTPGCLAYPVRPFTCRVFGRRVPPVFWGIECPPEAVDSIFCPDVEIPDRESEKDFLDKYPLYWTELADLSASVSVFSQEQLDAIREASGVKDIFVSGWKEFALLSKSSPQWLKKNFSSFWEKHGTLL